MRRPRRRKHERRTKPDQSETETTKIIARPAATGILAWRVVLRSGLEEGRWPGESASCSLFFTEQTRIRAR